MNVSSLNALPILQTNPFGVAAAFPVTASSSTTQVTPATTPDITVSSVVTISALGNFLSVASSIADSLLQSPANTTTSFNNINAATQLFVNSLNSFLTSGVDNLQSLSGTSLADQFTQLLTSQSTSGNVNGVSLSTVLASLGIDSQTTLTPNTSGLITLNPNVLLSAFNSDSTGATLLLAQSLQSITKIAAALATQNAQAITDLAQASATQSLTTAATSSATQATIITPTSSVLPNTAIDQLTALAQQTAADLLTATTQQVVSNATTTPTPATTTVTATQPTVTTAPVASTTVTPVEAPLNAANALSIATNPLTAFALAAYHLVDGVFDTGRSVVLGNPPKPPSYSEIFPVKRVRPV